MEERRTQKTRNLSHMCLLLLALLQTYTPSSALNITNTNASAPNPTALVYRTRPAGIRVAVGEPAVFRCGVPEAAPNLTFTLHGGHGTHNLTCPAGHVEDIPEALYGSCERKNGLSLAVWTIKGTSFYDNGTKVECQQLKNPEKVVAVLHVYENGMSNAVLVGCAIGGFFGMLIVVALTYVALQRSGTLQKWFSGEKTEEDMTTIVTKY